MNELAVALLLEFLSTLVTNEAVILVCLWWLVRLLGRFAADGTILLDGLGCIY